MPTLFMRRDAVEASWQWITPILDVGRGQRGAAPTLRGRRVGTAGSGPADRKHVQGLATALTRGRSLEP